MCVNLCEEIIRREELKNGKRRHKEEKGKMKG